MNEIDTLIQEQYKKLPENLKQAISSISWKELVKATADTNKLTGEQAETLERETLFVLYGFESLEDYRVNISREVGVNDLEAKILEASIQEKVFKTILNEVDKLNKSNPDPSELPPSLDDESEKPPIKNSTPPITIITEPRGVFAGKTTLEEIEAKQAAITTPSTNGVTTKLAPHVEITPALIEQPEPSTPSKNDLVHAIEHPREIKEELPNASKPQTTQPSNPISQPIPIPTSILEEKMGHVLNKEELEESSRDGVRTAVNNAYPGGIDPYREPIE